MFNFQTEPEDNSHLINSGCMVNYQTGVIRKSMHPNDVSFVGSIVMKADNRLVVIHPAITRLNRDVMILQNEYLVEMQEYDVKPR